ncbi:mis12-mtw1 family protein [Moniliophthora roreri MCA 2997]|uniref:Mis12-mtw1 family protein n=2 Tax=Moniliophthora roreri TaxID=221103 RepID=V2XZY3_MONRO|nr:mis12-mtw1 family protein [Moniliophthora roreri MCA 2997]
MVPSQSQSTSKRKLPEDSNPLLAAAKRLKSDQGKGASGKRKAQHGTEQSGGLLIVHAPEPFPRPSSAQGQSSSRHTSQPLPDRRLLPSQSQHHPIPTHSSSQPNLQPSQKQRAGSQPPTSFPQSIPQASSRPPLSKVAPSRSARAPSADGAVEQDIRAMEDEADRLRRESRARLVDPSLHLSSAQPEDTPANHSSRLNRKVVDTRQRIPVEESPMITRNKSLREGAMAAIRAISEEPETEEQRGRNQNTTTPNGKGHKRKSSVSGRGKRISASFETTGAFTEPHKSVSHESFYKHIDVDLPESERLRQLFIWCHSRTIQDPSTPSSSTSFHVDLPPLSAKAALLFKDVLKMELQSLAEKQVDLNLYSPSSSHAGPSSAPQMKKNEQNVSNRRWEAAYSEDIRKMEDEEEAWKKVESLYDSFVKKERLRIDKRKVELESLASHSFESINGAKSAKAQGKQKASESDQDWVWLPSEQYLPESQRSIVSLCKSLLNIPQSRGEERVVGPSSGSHLLRIEKEQAEERLRQRYADLRFNLDQVHSYVNTARAATRVAEAELDKRYGVLSMALSAKSREGQQPPSFSSTSTSSSTAAQTLKGYLPQDVSYSQPQAPSRDPRDLFRALAHVDSERPPAKIGDEVRRAARELQRIEEAGGVGVGERRLTLPPTGQQTPRKVPGTPRRGNTPARDRERTPGR